MAQGIALLKCYTSESLWHKGSLWGVIGFAFFTGAIESNSNGNLNMV